ncbi:MAG: MBL fold metallo-hydrolase, partial [Chitinophagales bacterium]
YWGEKTTIQNIQLTAAPARHFSGRTIIRNRSLWSSFILKTESHQIYIGGDSGYDSHFKQIGKDFGKFDLAILECGQYNPAWKYIHMMPEETVQAAIDLNADIFIPVHWGKFDLSLHPWTEPIERATAHAQKLNVPYFTPLIGAITQLNNEVPSSPWWRNVK